VWTDAEHLLHVLFCGEAMSRTITGLDLIQAIKSAL